MSSPKTTPNNKKVRKIPWPRKRGGKWWKIDLLLKNTSFLDGDFTLSPCSENSKSGGHQWHLFSRACTLSFPMVRDWKMILKSKLLEFAKKWRPLFGPLFWQIQPDIVPRLVRLKCDEEIVLFTKGPKNDSANCQHPNTTLFHGTFCFNSLLKLYIIEFVKAIHHWQSLLDINTWNAHSNTTMLLDLKWALKKGAQESNPKPKSMAPAAPHAHAMDPRTS